MLTEKEFYFVRHGQTDWNIEHRAQGQTDVPLNIKGRQQAFDAAQSVTQLKFATICSSPLSRALETANAIASVTGGRVSVLEDLIECSWGVREGETKGGWFEKWKRGIETPDGAEPYEEFLSRAVRAINQALDKPGPVLIVAHGGIYWAVQLHRILQMQQSSSTRHHLRDTPGGARRR